MAKSEDSDARSPVLVMSDVTSIVRDSLGRIGGQTCRNAWVLPCRESVVLRNFWPLEKLCQKSPGGESGQI